MKIQLSIFFSFLFLQGSTTGLRAADAYIGWIPVQTIQASATEEFDLSRWIDLGAEGKIELLRPRPLATLDAKLDPVCGKLRLLASPHGQGVENLTLRLTSTSGHSLEGIFTVAIQPLPTATFRYFGNGSEKTVCVAGSFNQWSPASFPLENISENRWELSIPLPPGSHPYKLVVDGKWRLDPANAQKIRDPGGNENSVIQVSPSQPAPVLYADQKDDRFLTFTLSPEGSTLESVSAVVEMPGGTSKEISAEAVDDTHWRVSLHDLPPAAWIRMMGVGSNGTPAFPARAQVGGTPTFGSDRHDDVMYMALVDRMVDGDPSNNPAPDSKVEPPAQYYGGDLVGLRKLLEKGYFDKIGVNTLWLSPVNQNPPVPYQEFKEPKRWYTGYHGYWPISSTEVEPRFGGNDALAELVKSARAKNIRVLLDLVLAHVHQDHSIYRQHPDWFGTLTLPDGSQNLRRWDNETQFTTWFEPFLPRFNYDVPQACEFLIQNAAEWVDRYQLDGFRLDAVKHIPPKFWSSFRSGLRSRLPRAREDSFYLVGETFMDRKGINSFIGPNRLDGQFEFPLYDSLLATLGTQTEDFASLEASVMASDRIFGPETAMSPLLGNHDKSRFLAYADGDLPDLKEPDEFVIGWSKPPKVNHPTSYAKLRMAFTFLLTSSGVPMIYYGDELGLTGAQDPDNRRMLPNLEKLSSEEKMVQEHVAKLNTLRAAHPALRYGSRRCLHADANTYAVVRAYLDDRVLIIYNRSENRSELKLSLTPELSGHRLIDQIGKLGIKPNVDNKTVFSLPPVSTSVFTTE